MAVACASGTRHTATWTGVPVLGLFTDTGLGDETTYLLIESTDDYRVCIDVYVALNVVIAYARDGIPIDREHDYETHFVAPDVDESRTVKDVRAVRALALDPATDPKSLKNVFKKP